MWGLRGMDFRKLGIVKAISFFESVKGIYNFIGYIIICVTNVLGILFPNYSTYFKYSKIHIRK